MEVLVDVGLPGTTESIKFSHPMKSVVCKDVPLSTRRSARKGVKEAGLAGGERVIGDGWG